MTRGLHKHDVQHPFVRKPDEQRHVHDPRVEEYQPSRAVAAAVSDPRHAPGARLVPAGLLRAAAPTDDVFTHPVQSGARIETNWRRGIRSGDHKRGKEAAIPRSIPDGSTGFAHLTRSVFSRPLPPSWAEALTDPEDGVDVKPAPSKLLFWLGDSSTVQDPG